MNRSRSTRLMLLGAILLAGCTGGASDPGTGPLKARLDAQAAEIEALRKTVKEVEARSRLLEERLSASAPRAGAAAAAAPAAAPADEAPSAGPSPAETAANRSMAEYLETDTGRQKLAEAVELAEKRRAEKTEAEQKERIQGFIKERVNGYLTEQLALDTAQQQTVLAVALETTEKMGEIWRGMRETRGDPSQFAQAREKSNEIRQQAVEKIQQALTVDQFNKFQDLMNEGGAFLFGAGGRGGPGGQGGGTPGGGNAGGRGGGR
jgi:hypothetical protein